MPTNGHAAAPPRPFHVIIAGGSIAGLTLAHCLNRAGITWTILESHDSIAPQVGASIGIFPNGARILDQLGVFAALERHIAPCRVGNHWRADGSLSFVSNFPELYEKRFGYPMAFLDRQTLLAELYAALPEEDRRRRVLTGKRVARVEQSDAGVKAFTRNGEVYTGDIIAGADGVRSTVRGEMWRSADEMSPGLVPPESRPLEASYACIFGISNPIEGLRTGESDIAFGTGISYLGVTGAGGRVYWFLFKKLPQTFHEPNIPRYTPADAAALAQENAAFPIGPTATFGALWENRIAGTLTALEENLQPVWTFGRFVLLGDSAHKMTPNLGQGGNSAIESAAALSNVLLSLQRSTTTTTTTTTTATIAELLARYQHARQPRVAEISTIAAWVTRLQVRDGLRNALFVDWIAPNAGDLPANMSCGLMTGAEKLAQLPEPERAQHGWMAFDSSVGAAADPSPLHRLIQSSVPFGVLLAASIHFPHSNIEASSMALDVAIYSLWTLESRRHGLALSPASLAPVLFSLPPPAHAVFYATHYSFCGFRELLPADQRGIGRAAAMTVLPALLLPAAAAATHSSSWPIFPILVSLFHWLLLLIVPASTSADKSPTADTPYLRHLYSFAVCLAAAVHWRWIGQVCFSNASSSFTSPYTFQHAMCILWLLLHVHDLKAADRTRTSWWPILGCAVVALAFVGPVGMCVGMWAWREGVLGRLRHGRVGLRMESKKGNGGGGGGWGRKRALTQ